MGRQRLTPTFSTEATEATVMGTTDLATGPTATPLTASATDLSTARGRLRLSPRLKPMLKLSPTTATTDSATMDLATGATATATAMDLSTARGRLRPSPRLRLSPTTTATDLSTARGRLRPRLTLTTTVDTDTAMDSATAMVATVLATGPTGDKLLQSLQDLNHRRKTLTLFV